MEARADFQVARGDDEVALAVGVEAHQAMGPRFWSQHAHPGGTRPVAAEVHHAVVVLWPPPFVAVVM